jgi:hypothetical protein
MAIDHDLARLVMPTRCAVCRLAIAPRLTPAGRQPTRSWRRYGSGVQPRAALSARERQLSPGPDKPRPGSAPLWANTGCEQLQQGDPLFDHIVSQREQLVRDCEAEKSSSVKTYK